MPTPRPASTSSCAGGCGRPPPGRAAVVLQGSVVDPAVAQSALDEGVADLVEMTRAQIAEPRLVALVRAGQAARVRPCILCNQACHVRDNRNPIVSCVGEPRSGHETVEPADRGRRPRCVARSWSSGAGVAGLECARVLAARGHRVRVRGTVQPGRRRVAGRRGGSRAASACRRWPSGCWPNARLGRGGGDRGRGHRRPISTPPVAGGRGGPGHRVPSRRRWPSRSTGRARCSTRCRSCPTGPAGSPDGPVVVHDPVGGPVGVGVAEWLAGAGFEVALVTPDQIAGTLLSLTGDLADANTRLQRAGVRRELRALLRGVADGRALLEDVWTGDRRTVECASIVDCGHRLPEESLYLSRPGTPRAGDCVAPRGILEAVLEGRRLALEPSPASPPHRPAGGTAAEHWTVSDGTETAGRDGCRGRWR